MNFTHDIPLRRAALIAGLGLLAMMGTPYAEFQIMPKLLAGGDIEAAVEAMRAYRGLFVTAILIYTTTFTADVVVAWALYVLLAPVNRALSLLTAWFRIVYTVMAFAGLAKLVVAFRLVFSESYAEAVGTDALHAQLKLLTASFGHEWGYALVVFGVYLCLLGYLLYRAAYVPKVIGILVAISGVGYVAFDLGPYVLPGVDLGWLMVTFFGELVLMLWLLIRGWKIEEPESPSIRNSPN